MCSAELPPAAPRTCAPFRTVTEGYAYAADEGATCLGDGLAWWVILIIVLGSIAGFALCICCYCVIKNGGRAMDDDPDQSVRL